MDFETMSKFDAGMIVVVGVVIGNMIHQVLLNIVEIIAISVSKSRARKDAFCGRHGCHPPDAPHPR